MILIVGDYRDSSIDVVIDWINALGCEFIRSCPSQFINYEFGINIATGNSAKYYLKVNEIEYQISSLWFRADIDGFPVIKYIPKVETRKFDSFDRIFRYEFKQVKRALFNPMDNIRFLSGYDSIYLNKIEVLRHALKIGLRIPETIITTSKADIVSFYKEFSDIIIKPCGEGLSLINDKTPIYQYAHHLTSEEINEFDDHFFPTLFQQMIIKKIDIRSFILKDEFFSMAIFSNGVTDFRNGYGSLRFVPYKLPKHIELKLLRLFKVLKLNTGSVDLVLDQDEKSFYFLEINPNGQFGFLSSHCNYYLEEKIANFLCNRASIKVKSTLTVNE